MIRFKKICLAFICSCVTLFTWAQTIEPPSNLIIPEASISATSVTLLWDKPTEYKDIKTYQIFQNGKLIGTSSKTNFTVNNLLANVKYSFSVKAVNDAKQISSLSNIVKCKTKSSGKTFNVVDFGAVGDGKTKNTIAIQKAIDACTKGGKVYIPAGTFLSGALYLKSDMTLYLAEGATLKGTTDVDDYYPLILNRFEGWEMKTLASLINAGTLNRDESFNVKNLSIEGKGTIKGGGSTLGAAMIKKEGIRGRGRLICIMNAENVNIQGLNIEDAPCWTIHYIYCKNVVLHDLNIISTARNGDGVDPDSSIDSYIFNCTFSTGDDCIAIKSGKNPEGYYVGKPTNNIRITNCDFVKGHSLAVGSEMSGGVSNVFIQDCKIGNLLHGLQIKATKDRGGYVKNVIVRDCELLKITLYTQLNYNNDGEAAPVLPQFSDMEFSNLNLSTAKSGQIVIDVNGFANEKFYTRNIVFENLTLPQQSIVKVKNCELLSFKNVLNADGTKPEYQVVESKNIVY